MYFNHKNRLGDVSYNLIDRNLVVYENHWLQKYKIPYLNINSAQKDVYANQIYFDNRIDDFTICFSESNKISLHDYYQLKEAQPNNQCLTESVRHPMTIAFDKNPRFITTAVPGEIMSALISRRWRLSNGIGGS